MNHLDKCPFCIAHPSWKDSRKDAPCPECHGSASAAKRGSLEGYAKPFGVGSEILNDDVQVGRDPTK